MPVRDGSYLSKNLNYPVQYVKGIGPKRAAALAKQGVETVRDLLYYFPFGYIDLSQTETINNLRSLVDSGKWVTVIGTVRAFDLVGRPPRQRFVVIVGDETGTLQVVFFQSVKFFKNAFTVGETIAVSGKVTSFNNRLQMVHPSIDRLSGGAEDDGGLQGFLHTKGIVPKYGSSEKMKDVNLNVKGFRKIIRSVLDEFLDCVKEMLPSSIIDPNQFLPLPQALSNIHFPKSPELLLEAKHRLKFDELFAMQMLLALRRRSVKSEAAGIAFNVQSRLARQIVDLLPFKLTKAQQKVINEIAEDMKSPKPMNRLLQGDVGSGKTIVALIAMLIALDNGYQVAFMAPTEILAEQHFQTLTNILKDIPVNIRLLIGGQKTKLREDILQDIQRGSAQIVVGTHALIQEDVTFANLGFIVIDEQHRFGVTQRVALREKGINGKYGRIQPDILVMTATPIPRTLSLTIYGDLDVSIIDELPSNRKSIKTTLRLHSEFSSVCKFIYQQVKNGQQVYIVYPLVEESEKMDLKAATESYETLRKEIFPDLHVSLLHGRMASYEKDEIMGAFKGGKIDILVSTTVIEVGIDVPNASVMVIEHAERFGLSQLHQLRGRVGRGAEQSYCLLVAPDWYAKYRKSTRDKPTIDGEDEDKYKSVRRLQSMLDITDGFKIAEIDLELRGPGDFFGTRQSGLPSLQIANLLTDGDILMLARSEAFKLIELDPHLRRPEHQQLKQYFEDRMKDALTLLKGA